MNYFTLKKAKHSQETAEKSETPVLTEEDEAFFQKITSNDDPPPLPARPQDLPITGESSTNNAQMVLFRDPEESEEEPPPLPERPPTRDIKGKDAQIALMNGAQEIPLPEVPDTPEDVLVGLEGPTTKKGKEKEKTSKRQNKWSFLRRDSRDSKRKAKAAAGTDLLSAAQSLKSADTPPNSDETVPPDEAKKEEEEMTGVLDQLNLAAVNNRVFSISKESQEILHKFTLVLKDIVNGVPTAYDDLESLLTNSNHQLQRTYKHLPPFLQNLIKSLPSKMTASMGPEVLAAAAEKHGLDSKYTTPAASAASKMGVRIKVPSLKDLVTKPGIIIGMLKSILNFLKLRFPAFLGMNVLMSLALFVLLLIFWYCHKRGRQVRLEKERVLTEAEAAEIERQIEEDIARDPDMNPPSTEFDNLSTATTTAPEGAPIDDVAGGMMQPATTRASVVEEGKASYAEGGALARDMAEREKARGGGQGS